MAQFSLSPAVTVREVNLTGYVPNIPSAKTGAILRANKGPCLDITAVTNENDLVSVFGKPTAENYQDWFQCWNFLQYSASLYVVRPVNKTVKNAGVSMSGTTGFSPAPFKNFYNQKVAEFSLEDANFTGTTDTLYFINKEVTNDQRLAVAVCSSPQYFKSQIGVEFYAEVSNALVGGSPSVTATGNPTLTIGSQVILNGGRLGVVTNVSRNGGNTVLTFDGAVSASDVASFWAKSVSASVSNGDGTYTATFEKAFFTLKKGVTIGAGVITSITSQNATEYSVNFSGNPSVGAGIIKTSNVMGYGGKIDYNASLGDFATSVGQKSIKMQAGFVLEAGVDFTLSGGTEILTVATVDDINNVIGLTAATTEAVTGSTGAITIAGYTTSNKLLTGCNFYDKVYDAGLITKTKTALTSISDGSTVNIIAQSLASFNSFFDYPPVWSKDEFLIVILRKNDDGFYEKAEAFTCSYNPEGRDTNGNKTFVENVIYNGSKYVYAKLGKDSGDRVDTAVAPVAKILSVTGTTYTVAGTQGEVDDAFTLFADPESFDINILICNEKDINNASTIAETRKDCVAIVAPFNYAYLSQNGSNDCTAWLLDEFGSQTVNDAKQFTGFGTYSAVYGNMKYQYDKFNNVNRWINVAGDVAGLYAQTDSTNDPWWAPAGTQRGIIRNAIKLAFAPNKQNRDELYVNSINPIMAIAGQGSAVVWGQKTATSTPSAFDRVNVRRLLIHLEKSISTAVAIGLFEFNDVFTRTRLFNIIDPFLKSVQNRRGLYAYKVVVDETNNTNQVIDQNGLVIDVYLQPTKVAEFIRVSAIVTPTGANFKEYIGMA